MAGPAQRRMTVAEFLTWDSPGDVRYQLLDGMPMAMAPPAEAHGAMVINFGRHLANCLDRRPP